MIKFLKLLRFNPRIGMLAKTFQYARADLSSFGFVFLIFIVAYGQMGFAVFNRSLTSYKSFPTALTTCFRMLLGQINAPEMLSVSRFYGRTSKNYLATCALWFLSLGVFYFVSYVSLVFISLISIFIAM